MFRRISLALSILSLSTLLMAPDVIDKEPTIDIPQEVVVEMIEPEIVDVMEVPEPSVVLEVKDVVSEPAYSLTEEEIELIALVTMAEAEGESEYGKRLVIDTILNRVDHEWSYWPDSVSEVIYQKGQFSSMWNGRVDRCYVMEEIVQLVREELENRTNYDVVFFMMGGYSSYGTPEFKEGVHYFSSY